MRSTFLTSSAESSFLICPPVQSCGEDQRRVLSRLARIAERPQELKKGATAEAGPEAVLRA